MEKTITLRNTEITFSIWDLGGQREFLSMLPLVRGVGASLVSCRKRGWCGPPAALHAHRFHFIAHPADAVERP